MKFEKLSGAIKTEEILRFSYNSRQTTGVFAVKLYCFINCRAICVVRVFSVNRPLVRSRPRWKYNITMNLREMVWRA